MKIAHLARIAVLILSATGGGVQGAEEESSYRESSVDMSSGGDIPSNGDPSPAQIQQVNAAAVEASTNLDTIPVTVEDEVEQPSSTLSGVRNRVVEEIIVTAQKREERLQDVPISIQAFSGDALAARGIEETTQLGQSVPGLQFTQSIGYALIYMRGIGTDNFIPSVDPSIATYLDGVYVPGGQVTAQSLGNVERVEVLKGPQGTLFGRNSTGGAISIITEEPGEVFKGSAEGELGNFNKRQAKFMLSGPLTDWVSASLGGSISHQDPYYTSPSYDIQDDESKAVRLKVNIHPTDELSLSLTAFQLRYEGAGSLISKNTEPSALGSLLLIQPEPDDYTLTADYPPSGNGKQESYYGTLSWSLPWFDARLIGSDQLLLNDYGDADFDGSAQPLASFRSTNQFTDLQTAELQIVSNEQTPGAEQFQWVTGLYYLQSDAGYDPASLRLGARAVDRIAAIITGQETQASEQLRAQLLGLADSLGLENTPLGTGGLTVSFSGLLGTKSYSAYAQGTYFINDTFDVTVGGRYQQEERFLTKSNSRVSLEGEAEGANALPLFTFDLPRQETSNFSPKLVLSIHPRENALVYLSYSVGFKSGTFNIINLYTQPQYIVPEEVTTFELGAKVDFLGGLLRLNGAIYNNQIDNLQTGFVSLLAGGAIRFQTAGKARTRGAEVDGTWVPLPDWNPGLALTANAAYVDAVYTDFRNGLGFSEDGGVYTTNNDYSGNRIVRTPKVSAGLGVVQTIDVSQGTWEISLDEYYNSGFFYNSLNTVEEAPYAVLNARISYLHEPWKVRTTLFVQNLLDREYDVQQLETDFGVNHTRAAPLEYGLRVKWEF